MSDDQKKIDHKELAESLAAILHLGLVSLRGTAGQDKEYVKIEANHLHNLPFCLARMNLGAIRYYYEQERPCYLDEMKEMGGRGKSLMPDYERAWSVIGRYLSDHPEEGNP